MENEPPSIFAQEEGRSRRGRLMGKLFGGRERKASGEEQSNDLNDFLRGPSDTLTVAHAGPPVLTKLDTSSASRYPNALTVEQYGDQGALSLRQRSHSPRSRNKKGLVVRFVDTFPEIMGQGGDECDMPTMEISRHRRPRPPPVTSVTAPPRPADILEKPTRAFPERQREDESSFIPTPIRRTQTGYSTISDAPEPEIPAGQNAEAKYLGTPVTSQDEKRKSFIEIHHSQMREAEGLAFANAVRSAGDEKEQPRSSPRPSHDLLRAPPLTQSPEAEEVSLPPEIPPHQQPHSPSPPSQTHQLPPTPNLPRPSSPTRPESPDTKYRRNQALEALENSPTSVYSNNSSINQPYGVPSQRGRFLERENGSGSPSSPLKTGMTLHDAVVAAGEDALHLFVLRTRHLFELFRLHSESVRPLSSCSFEELARAGLWWFLAGRLALEAAVRERPESPTAQQRNEMAKQQAYANLAKGYWLSEEIIPEVAGARNSPIDQGVDEARQTLVANLRKLAISMKRNNFLPPEEALLPQAIDRSVWLEYPQLSQDIIALLWGSSASALAQTQPVGSMEVQDALPLGDSPFFFCFGRLHADVFLMEQGMGSQRFHMPCILSVVRPQKQQDIMFVIASQNNTVQLRISANNAAGPTWDDVRWRSETCTLDVRLPRGFLLVVQCAQPDYRMLWNMYDFSSKVQASLFPLPDEQLVFRSTLRAFQYFDNDPQSRQFPKESVPNCDVALFERLSREGAATGPRTYHVGHRLAIVTGPRTKTLSGINQAFHPHAPVQYGFLRSDQNDPALSLKFENSRAKGNMVLSFNDEKDRLRLHSLLIGTALRTKEQVYAEIPLQGIWFSERYGDTSNKGLMAMSRLPWQRARIINEDNAGERPACVLAEKLRVVFEFKDGMITDRVNVAPGEFKIRLNVANPSCLMVYRMPQRDMTVALTEAKVSRENALGLAQGIDAMQKSASIRTYMFPSVQDLHTFETSITGFTVLFDAVASAFAISRRRMVVPIHKKWEAGMTRIQVVQQDGVMQLLAFFEDFSHGESMSFALKGTDVFECFSRSSKFGLRIDDAKFPLPKVLGDIDDPQAAADAAFVCLDMPELPGEHDDISILFDSEADRDNLIPCLPAPVKGSRLSRGR